MRIIENIYHTAEIQDNLLYIPNPQSKIRNPKSMKDIWAIILAAGESKRMDSPKMLLPFGMSTIIERVIENVAASDVDKTLVVLGSSGDEILKRIESTSVKHCFNESYKEGMLSSVKCGFRNLPEKYEAAMVVPGDFPGIGPHVMNMLISSLRQSRKKIFIPLFGNRRGHPILISFDLRDEILGLDPGKGLRELMEIRPDEVLEVGISDPSVIRDIDTMEDYNNELKLIT